MMHSSQKAAAIFDVDLTLTRHDSLFLLFKFMVKKKPLLLVHLVPIGFGFLLKQLGAIGNHALKDLFYRLLDGFPVERVQELMFQFWQECLFHDTLPGAVARVRHHKSQGNIIILLSASVDLYLEHLANFLQADALICTKLGLRTGGKLRYQIQGENCHGVHKLSMLQRHAIFAEIDLQRSFGYSDHHSDLPFLQSVGNPVVVNGTPKLKRFAARLKWRMESFC
ncbi:MAG: HAD family hydrolase [bacterium]